MFPILVAVTVLFLMVIASAWLKSKKRKTQLSWIPSVPGKPIVGNVFDFGDTTATLKVLSRYVDQFDGMCVIDFATRKVILASNYDFLAFILTTTQILNKSNEYKFLFNWLGNGLLTAKGPKWTKMRKILTPAFHFSILEQFVPVFASNTNIMVKLLEKETEKDSVDIYPYVTMCALDIICETAMGVSLNAQTNNTSDYVFAVKEMCRITVDRSFSLLGIYDALYPLTKDYYREKRYLKTLHSYTNSVIDSRRKEVENADRKTNENDEDNVGAKKKMAFLDLLLRATLDGKPLSHESIREEVDTFMFEGHDTTASAITFTLYCLTEHPDIQKKAVEEQKEIFGTDKLRSATYRDLQDMKYLELVIKETLRLYPSVPFFGRLTDKDTVYKGGVIPEGMSVMIFTYGANRNPKYFPDPEKFDPTRFEDRNGTAPFAYIPFSAGPRNCIGLKWKVRRKMITPAFHFSILEHYIASFEPNEKILIEQLEKELDKDSVDIYPYINLYALDVICETAMGVSVNAQKYNKSNYVQSVKEVCRIAFDRAFSLLKRHYVTYILSRDYYKEVDVVSTIHAHTNSVIETRRKELENKTVNMEKEQDDFGRKKKMAFLDILLQSTIDGKPLSTEDIREEVDTFMFEGHDTTSSAMSFALYLLANHPDVQNCVLEEQKAIFGEDITRNASYNDLQAMKYLELVIKETLRLYPSVPVYGRVTNEDTEYKGNIIPKGTNITVFAYGVLRDPDNYSDPDKFKPERFAHYDGTRPFSFIPFSAGPRNCIGQKFGMLEVKSTLSTILRNFELLPSIPEHKLILLSEAVLKSKNGIRIRLKRREW